MIDMVNRLKLESRPRNFRDETKYKESDMPRRIIVVIKPYAEINDHNFYVILEDYELEDVFKCEIDEGRTKYFLGQFILTFRYKLQSLPAELVKQKNVYYVGFLKEYIEKRSRIISENPLSLNYLGKVHNLKNRSIQQMNQHNSQNRFSLALEGFSTRYDEVRNYVVKILGLEYVERSREKISEATWCEKDTLYTAQFTINISDKKPEQLIDKWNSQSVIIRGNEIKAKCI